MAQFAEFVTRTVNCPYCHDSAVVKNGKGTDASRVASDSSSTGLWV